jgi:prepilin-type N-terminal cleavage/methylation domain-containing protein
MHAKVRLIRPAHARRAFSLVELIAVMVVLAILGAGLARRIADRQPGIQAAHQHRQLELLTRQAQDLAMTTGRRHWLVFSTSAPISLVAETSAGSGYATAAAVLHPVTAATLTAPALPTGTLIGNLPPNGVVGFSSIGRPILSTGADITSNITFSFNSQVLSIAPSTGRISVSP